MAKSRQQELHDLIASTEGDIGKINSFFSQHISDAELLTHILREDEKMPVSFADHLSDKLADFGGSWTFIIIFFTTLVVWILINSYIFLHRPFDPYPFILLNLVLSCVAAIQAPLIMMSQNRKEEKDRQRAQNDYLINLKAEMEIKNLQLNMRNLFEVQKKQMEVLDELKKEICR